MVASPQEIDWLIVGGSGQLAQSMRDRLELAGVNFVITSRAELDISDIGQVENFQTKYRPRVIFNAAAWTDVEAAEDNESEAFKINVGGAQNVAEFSSNAGSTLIHISTDYVFSGASSEARSEDSAPAPTSAYGRSKAAGEAAVTQKASNSYIVRTAWLYGPYGKNFAKTILRKASQSNSEIKVVSDQIGQPTFSNDVADQIFRMVKNNVPTGIYHATNSGVASWYDFACELLRLAGFDESRVLPISSSAYPSKVLRPVNSVLSHDKWQLVGMKPPRDWRAALDAAMPMLLLQEKVKE